MRTVARYSLSAEVPGSRDVLQDYFNLLDRTDAWLGSKGARLENRHPEEILRYPDGREATVRRWGIDLGTSGLREITLAEPIEGAAMFETRLLFGLSDRSLAALWDLRVGGREEPLGPVRFDAVCPRIVREFLSYDLPWTYGTFPVPKGVCRFRGNDGGEAFAKLLVDAHRLLPVVAVAEYQGLVLHPGIADALSRDLVSLAVVGLLDDSAAWRLTRSLGVGWSCYNGAIRLYWPGLDPESDPRGHPLWTSRRLLDDVPDTGAAATRIRSVLRRQLMSASAFAVREPHLFEMVRTKERSQRFAAERAKLKATDDFALLAESYAKEAEDLRKELDERRKENEALRSQVENLLQALQWRDVAPEETLTPESVAPPKTVSEAVAHAQEEGADALVFGPNVDEGVRSLAPDAGPPSKVLQYLIQLAELSRARASGPLGTSTLEWLKQRNVAASLEGEGVKRTWSGREYEWHLKPADAVSPDRCVRIYFDWDEASKRIFVGWVGRHP